MASKSRSSKLSGYAIAGVVALDLLCLGWGLTEVIFAVEELSSVERYSIMLGLVGITVAIFFGLGSSSTLSNLPGFWQAAVFLIGVLVLAGHGIWFFVSFDSAWRGQVIVDFALLCLAGLALRTWKTWSRWITVAVAMLLGIVIWCVPPPPERVHLIVHAWQGDNGTDIFRYRALARQYEQTHPFTAVEVREDVGQRAHHDTIIRDLADGSGLADVVAVELRTMGEVYFQPSNWVDLKAYLPDIDADYVPYRMEGGRSPDGVEQLGLPVDMPALAMCYRRDLFQAAGLPVDRDKVSALWPTWQAFIQVGQQYTRQTGKGFVDTVEVIFEAATVQNGDPLYYDRTNHFVGSSSGAVAKAWQLSVEILDAGISAYAPLWTQEWTSGMSNGRFATMACASWLLGAIQQNAGPDNRGNWDIAALPGGGANWGGTWLTVPRQSKYPRQAAELAAFLTGQQGGLVTATNADSDPRGLMLPAHLRAVEHSQIQNLTYGYFNNAPVGRIFSANAKTTRSVYLGPRYMNMREIFVEALNAVQQSGNTESAQREWQGAARRALVLSGAA